MSTPKRTCFRQSKSVSQKRSVTIPLASARSLKYVLVEIVVAILLVVVVVLVWTHVRDRSSFKNWSTPLGYGGDDLEVIGWIKAAAEGDYIPFGSETIRRLGAPYQANWDDYPMYGKITTFGFGIVARWFGLFQATNFAVLLGHVLSALSFYCCCRFLKYARVWAFVGGALFSFAYYHFCRNLGHVLLAYSYTIPWAILSSWIIAGSKRIRFGDRLFWISAICAAVVGLGNPYNLNLYVQLLCFAMVAQWFRDRRQENLRIGLLCLSVVGVAFTTANVASIAYGWVHGPNAAALERHYFESELYALKPIEFFIPPPTHTLHSLAEIGNLYLSSAYLRGEVFSPYLGAIGIAGLLWMFAECFWLLRQKQLGHKGIPPHALQTTWIIFYSVAGGINCLLSLCGLQFFRGTNRYSIFISALVLLFLVARMSRYSRKWGGFLNYGLAVAALLFGSLDQSPSTSPREKTIDQAKIITSDKAYGAAMEKRLSPGGMLFQLPVMSFPEAVPIHDVSTYEMLRPYLYTKTMRFSFGSARGRNRESWQWEVEKMPAVGMISTLEKYGFSAIYINRKGYADHAEGLLKQLAEAGRSDTFEDDLHEQVCVTLHPSSNPEFPHTDDRAQVVFTHGWSVKEYNSPEHKQWAGGDARLIFFSESPGSANYVFHALVGSITPRQIRVFMDGHELWKVLLLSNQLVNVEIPLAGRHGNNELEILTDAPPFYPKDSSVPLAFVLNDLTITKQH